MTEALKGYSTLADNIKIYVPSTTEVTESVDNSSQVSAALELLAKNFGGATQHEATGAWVSSEHGLVKERITIVEAYAAREDVEQGGMDNVLLFCKQLKKDMSQEAIALEHNGSMYFI